MVGLAASLGMQVLASLGAQTPGTQPEASAGAPTQEWKTYSYPDDGFSASYPSEPQVTKRDVPTEKGSFELRAYLAQDGETAMFVGVCDYGAAIAGTDPDDALKGAENGALSNSNAHLITDRKITLGIYHGLAYEGESDQAHFSAREYLVGTTLYQTLVVSSLGKPYDGTARFLDSFQLIARTAK